MDSSEISARRLISPRQVCLAAFIGSPVAACWCFARNYRELGQASLGQKWLIWGGSGSLVMLILLCMLPYADRIPHYIIPIAYSLGFREVAKQVHGSVVAEHISAGGRLASWWLVVGVSVLFLVGVFAVLIAAFFILS